MTGWPIRHAIVPMHMVGMKDDVAAFGVQHPFTRLVRGPSQDDPDEAFSRIPYEKVCLYPPISQSAQA